MKKIMSVALCLAMVLSIALLSAGCGSSQPTISVYNWGEYIDMDVLKQFEEETGIKVKYDTFGSNEEMYTKIKSGGGKYDVLIPSDYMIERLIQNDMLHELNYDNIPNAQYVMEKFRDSDFDPGNKHSIPYMWGTVGILYNKTMVNGEIDSWNALFDEQYAKQILMYDSARDSLMVGLRQNGYDINSRDEQELAEATQTLIDQKPLVLAYVMDEVKDKMIQGEAALALVYSGYVIDAIEENSDLAYCLPKEGSNVWMDSMVIPSTSQNPELAEKFIDFMCRPDIALKNIEYVAYSTPNQGTYDLFDDSMKNNPVAYPSDEELARCTFFHDLGDYNEKYDEAWLKVKTSN